MSARASSLQSDNLNAGFKCGKWRLRKWGLQKLAIAKAGDCEGGDCESRQLRMPESLNRLFPQGLAQATSHVLNVPSKCVNGRWRVGSVY